MLADRELTEDVDAPPAPATRLELLGEGAAVGPDGRVVLQGSQARRILAFLALTRERPVTRDELAEVLWPQHLPAHWAGALRGVLSQVRQFLDATGLGSGGDATLRYEHGAYRMGLRRGVVIDLEVARGALEEAEVHLSQGRVDEALVPAATAGDLLHEPLLAGDEADWLDQQRDRLRFLRIRALHIAAIALAARDQHHASIASATEALDLDPLDEASHQAVMVAHLAAGSPAGALRAYERCRQVLAEQLGCRPGPGVESLYRRTLALDEEHHRTEEAGTEVIDLTDERGDTDQAWAAAASGQVAAFGADDEPWAQPCRDGRGALARFDYEAAVEAFEAALTRADGAPPAERARIEAQLGGALRRLGRYASARSVLRAALVTARDAGDTETVASAVLDLVGGGGRGVSPDLDHPERAALLSEALAGLGAGPLSLRIAVMAELALALQLVDPDRCRVLAAAAHDLARASGHPSDRARAMVASRLTQMLPVDAEARLRATDQVIGARNNELTSELLARMLMWRLFDHAEMADRAGFDHDLDVLDDLTSRLGQPYWQWIAAGWRVTQAAIDGDLDDAERQANASLEIMAGTDHPEVAESWGAHLLGIRLLQGRGGELVEALEQMADARPAIPAYRAGLALALAQDGRHDDAVAMLDRFCGPAAIRVQRDTNWSGTLGALAAATELVGHEQLAHDLLVLLEPHGERMVVLSLYGGGGIYFGPVALHLGRLAALAGRPSEARVWLSHAQLRADRFGADGFAEAAQVAAADLPGPD